MYSSTILIVSKRKEISIKHKKAFEALGHSVFMVDTLPEMFEKIKEKEPELIMISDTIYENFVGIIKQIKVLTYNYSPVIIAISRSSDLDDRLNMLQNGADDCFGEEISIKELKIRISAYIRRYVENSLNPITGIIGEKLGLKHLRKTLDKKNNSAIMMLDVQNSSEYKEIYGEIAYSKVMQTIGALINSTLSKEDFISHFSNDKFILITISPKAEKIASFLAFAFDNMLDKFYSEEDFKNKFIKYFSDDTLEGKIPLMKLNNGIINLEYDNSIDEKMLLQHLNSLLKMCRKNKNSSYVIDRIKLNGKITKKEKADKILVAEKDEALSYLIQSACEIKGFKSNVINNLENFNKIYKTFKPNVIILDHEQKNNISALQICKKIKEDKSREIKIIFTSAKRKKTEILSAGADLYLPKPYDINTLLNWIEKFLKED